MVLRFLICLIVEIVLTSFGNTYGQVVQFQNLNFSSEIERKSLENIIVKKDTSDLMTMFFSAQTTDSKDEIDRNIGTINAMIVKLQSEVDLVKTNPKKVKLIYNKIHSTYFKKYELRSRFKDILISGNYNCLTATALYAMVLEKLKIPYVIKNLPTHVFLVVFPESDNIVIETTTPNFGYYKFSDAIILRYLEKLKKMKIISEEEYNSGDKDALFEKYYFKDKKISLRQLAGLYYYNLAIYASEDKNEKEVMSASKKSYILYPSDETEYILEQGLKGYLATSKYTSETDSDDFISLVKIGAISKMNESELLEYFNKMYYEQLIAKSNFDAFKRSYEKIIAELDSGAIRNEIDFKYYYEVARVNYNLGNTSAGEKFALKAFELQPENAEIIGMVSRGLRNKVYSSGNSKQVLEFLQKLADNNPKIQNIKALRDIFLLCYLDQAKYFYVNKFTLKGDEMLSKFEKLSEGQDISEIENLLYYVDLAYTAAAVEYYRLSNISKSRKVLQTGLKYHPLNERFKEMLNTMK